jgi:hypothetical protein
MYVFNSVVEEGIHHYIIVVLLLQTVKQATPLHKESSLVVLLATCTQLRTLLPTRTFVMHGSLAS